MRRERSRKPRRKVCSFCVDHAEQIDYKDIANFAVSQQNVAKSCRAAFPAFAQNISAN